MVASGEFKLSKAPHRLSLAYLPEEELQWTTVWLREVIERDCRLEASVFGIEGRYAREVLKRCKWPLKTVCGSQGLADAYHRPRFKRIWLPKSDLPIFQPSQVTELHPKPSGYLSPLTRTNIEALRVHKGQILLTCSGTIGNCTLAWRTLDGAIFSHDIIRITCKSESDTGYVYAFLRTKIGQALIRTNEYGAVVSHIEPHHLENIPIPDPPLALKKRIHDLVIRSYNLRDESNELLEKAEQILYEALNLPPIEKLRPRYFDESVDLCNYTRKLSQLDGRLDATYHNPLVDVILDELRKGAAEVTTVADPRISKRIILPGRFRRVYVQEGQGAVYFTGKHILELDPSDKKYLSFSRHARRIREELTIRHNMLLITCSGTLGNIVLCPRHWDGWVMTHDIIRVVPADTDVAGFLWVFLSSDYGQELIRRCAYGAVVPHIEDHHVAQVAIPLLKDDEVQAEINRLALQANEKRTEAYYAEQEAIRIVNEEVIHAAKNPASSGALII